MSISKHIKDAQILKFVQLVERLEYQLRYPQSEGLADEIRYTDRFETEFKQLLKEYVMRTNAESL